MIHNKEYNIIKQFLGDYNKEIYGRGLTGKVKMSPKSIALELGRLEKEGLLKSRKSGNMKYFRLNTAKSETKDVLVSAEITRKMELLKKQRTLANIFRKDDRIVGIFGSYAEGAQKDSSDIDIFIIGTKRKKDYDEQGKFLDLPISIKYFPETEFLNMIKQKNNLLKEIAKKHIIIFGAERFVESLWSTYYGLD
jgi:predicted nucleotidyltransferase